MAATKYSYTISTSFPNQKADFDRLQKEIQESAIVTALDRIDGADDACEVWFKDALSTDDQATLNSLIGAHSGEVLESSVRTPVVIEVDNSVPKKPDGRTSVVLSPMSVGWEVLWVGKATNDAAEEVHVTWPFSGPGNDVRYVSQDSCWELRDGRMHHTTPSGSSISGHESESQHGFTIRDFFEMWVVIPANTATAVGSGGNCYQDTENGILIPAGFGGAPDTHSVNLAEAKPAKVTGGFWRVHYQTGEVRAPSAETEAEGPMWDACHLVLVEQTKEVMQELPLGSPTGVMNFDTDQAEWIHATWKLAMKVTKNSLGWGDAGGWVMMYRPGS